MSKPLASKRWWIWWPLLGLGGWLALFGDNSPAGDAQVIQPTRAPRPVIPEGPMPAAPRPLEASEPSLVPAPRQQLYPAPASTADGATPARDLFSARNWNPPPPPPPPPAPPAPPVAPPLPYSFIGKKHEAESWEVYLTRGEQTFVAREGQVLEGTWRVDKIQPPSLTATYLPLGLAQTLSIGESR